jgi:hypothetical protein
MQHSEMKERAHLAYLMFTIEPWKYTAALQHWSNSNDTGYVRSWWNLRRVSSGPRTVCGCRKSESGLIDLFFLILSVYIYWITPYKFIDLQKIDFVF